MWERLPLAGRIPAGALVILLLAVASSLYVAAARTSRPAGLEMWTFSRPLARMYQPLIAHWNQQHSPPVTLDVLGTEALGQRTMAGFLSQVPVADLIEVERSEIGKFFSGPVEDVGFLDLTRRLQEEGLLHEFSEGSFSPWTTRGHIFGLPEDIDPVMLAYRADLVERAGIDMSQIHTWDDFARVMRPLLNHRDADGNPDRYPLNIWTTSYDQVEALILQAGGGYFDQNNRPILDSPENAQVIATIVSWTVGPDRIAADAPEFTAAGNALRLQGYVVCSIAPDWMSGVWKTDLPALGGKIKLMPLPAWTKGGRRTSVWGGTMLGIAKTTRNPEAAWQFARHLYLSDKVAKSLYETNGIISPVKRLWNSDFYDRPDPFFCGQAPGRMYIQLAPDVPRRTSSPYETLAKLRMQDVLVSLRDYAVARRAYTPRALVPRASYLLQQAQADVQQAVSRNLFLRPQAAPGAAQ